MRKYFLFLLIILASLSSACTHNFGTHAIQCAMVGEQKICFVREVWGLNGEQISLTTSENVCHRPSEKYDYVSHGPVGNSIIYAKIENGKINIYSRTLFPPKNRFPVEVVFEEYNPLTHFDRDFIKDGYQEFDLGKEHMTWCVNDIF